MPNQSRVTQLIKTMRRVYGLAFWLGCAGLLAACVALPARTYGEVTQVSTYPALQMGLFDGDVSYARLAQAGDFGLGTFDGLDGEMVALDGAFYQAKSDGSVAIVDPKLEAPFADVHFFRSQQQVHLQAALENYDQLKAYLTKQLPTPNRPYAFKIKANFPYLKIRSVTKQQEPFPSLNDAVAGQTVFELQNITGTLVGYAMPDYLGSVTVAGYHFHFISADHQHGGHMLDCRLTDAMIDIDYLDRLSLMIPQNAPFQAADLAPKTK